MSDNLTAAVTAMVIQGAGEIKHNLSITALHLILLQLLLMRNLVLLASSSVCATVDNQCKTSFSRQLVPELYHHYFAVK